MRRGVWIIEPNVVVGVITWFKAKVFVRDEETYGTEPMPAAAELFPGTTSKARLQTTLRPSFFQGVQVVTPDLEHASIELEVLDKKSDGTETTETIVIVRSDHITVPGCDD